MSVEVIKGRSQGIGSCNSCSKQINNSTGMSDNSAVHEIRLGEGGHTTSVRVCDLCAAELLVSLRKSLPSRKRPSNAIQDVVHVICEECDELQHVSRTAKMINCTHCGERLDVCEAGVWHENYGVN